MVNDDQRRILHSFDLHKRIRILIILWLHAFSLWTIVPLPNSRPPLSTFSSFPSVEYLKICYFCIRPETFSLVGDFLSKWYCNYDPHLLDVVRYYRLGFWEVVFYPSFLNGSNLKICPNLFQRNEKIKFMQTTAGNTAVNVCCHQCDSKASHAWLLRNFSLYLTMIDCFIHYNINIVHYCPELDFRDSSHT